MKPYVHAVITAKKFGGKPEDYMAIHEFFDMTKAAVPDMRHRMILHNAMGIYICEQRFGSTMVNSDGDTVSVRDIGEDHVIQDLGFIPTLEQCIKNMSLEPWMAGGRKHQKTRTQFMSFDESMLVD